MTSPINNNKCKLLILDLNINEISINELRQFFTSYGPIEWIETFPQSTSAIIYFVSYLIVDHLVNFRTCLIGQNQVRLRRFRLDQHNWHIDSHTLYVKLLSSSSSSSSLNSSNSILTQTSLNDCFQNYQSYINKIDIIHNNQALISFSNYDYLDQVLLLSSNMFRINDIPLTFERIIEKINKKSRWDQTTIPLTTIPILSQREPIVYKLMNHIEHLTKQLREQPNDCRNEITRLETEIFILKNENAQLKSKQKLSSNKNIEERLMALEDISNRLLNKQYHYYPQQQDNNKRKRSKCR